MSKRIVIVGGGAAGFFAAITAGQRQPGAEIQILEKGPAFLAKVRISGGGRCNVTHNCFDGRELTRRYPRGESALIGPYQTFQARDTVKWFADRGVKLKTEADGRMFPVTDSSQTIIDCLMGEARRCGISLIPNCGVEKVSSNSAGFDVTTSQGKTIQCDALLLATGGCRTPALALLATSLGHSLIPPVPSLFTFHIDDAWVKSLAGLSVQEVEASVPGAKLKERGPVLFTHWGMSGPAVLKISAWGARSLNSLNYNFDLHINWLPKLNEAQLRERLLETGRHNPAKILTNTSVGGIPSRLWDALVRQAIPGEPSRWSHLPKTQLHQLAQQLQKTTLKVTGKSLNKDEFVTCGGIALKEVDFKTMQSKICPGLFFAGEILDIDGITGGFNFQAAWTTGYLAGRAMAE